MTIPLLEIPEEANTDSEENANGKAGRRGRVSEAQRRRHLARGPE